MQTTSGVQFVVDTIMDATRRGTDASMWAGGMAMPPQVHLLLEHQEQPYLGYMTCRPILGYRDVTPALRGLGIMASLMGASRLVLVWENHSLWSERPGGADEPFGHVAVDVHRGGGHVQCWHPFEPRVAPAAGAGRLTTVVPIWGEPARQHDGGLPLSVWELLRMWREPREWDGMLRAEILAQLEESGYRMQWVSRDGAPGAPRP